MTLGQVHLGSGAAPGGGVPLLYIVPPKIEKAADKDKDATDVASATEAAATKEVEGSNAAVDALNSSMRDAKIKFIKVSGQRPLLGDGGASLPIGPTVSKI